MISPEYAWVVMGPSGLPSKLKAGGIIRRGLIRSVIPGKKLRKH